jgi:DNA-binding LytR/AlgR family response regulator
LPLPHNKVEGNVEISAAPDFIFVKSDKKIIKLNYKSISHVEAYGNYVKIYAEKMILTPQTLTDFLLKLPHNFVRIHKSFVVNIEELDCIDGNQVVLKNNTKLPIGKSYKKEILEKIL